MNNIVLFINSLLSYGVLFCFIAVLCTVAVFAGIKMRKSKNMKELQTSSDVQS